jgi:hypothetical protein
MTTVDAECAHLPLIQGIGAVYSCGGSDMNCLHSAGGSVKNCEQVGEPLGCQEGAYLFYLDVR